MHVPTDSRAADPLLVIERYPFATLIALPAGHAAHVPLVLVTRETERVLLGHVARVSPLADAIEAGCELLAIFRGPHAYVSPFDYDPEGIDPGEQVPTWNYVASQVRGRPRVLEAGASRATLAALAARFDSRGWTDAALPDGYREGLVRAIVAFELPAHRGDRQGQARSGPNDRASPRCRGRARAQGRSARARGRSPHAAGPLTHPLGARSHHLLRGFTDPCR